MIASLMAFSSWYKTLSQANRKKKVGNARRRRSTRSSLHSTLVATKGEGQPHHIGHAGGRTYFFPEARIHLENGLLNRAFS